MPARAARLALALLAGAAAASEAAFPYQPSACPPQSDYAGRRRAVLGWARQLLNGSLGTAGGSYGNRAFLRDTNTFIDVALDYSDHRLARGILVGLFSAQHSNGDVGTCCVPFGKDGKAQTQGLKPGAELKADVTTDAESSLVSAIYKYVRHTGDASILDVRFASQLDPVRRPVRDRLRMLLGYLGNSTGRFSQRHGLVWGSVCADWGDVSVLGLFAPAGHTTYIEPQSPIAINPYANAMYIIAMQNFAELLQPTAPAEAGVWRARAANTSKNAMRFLWMEDKQKFRPHLYDIGP